MRTRLVERVARAQIRWVLYRLRNCGNRSCREMRCQAPGGTDESGAVDAGRVTARRIVRADVARKYTTVNLAANHIERTVAPPTIRNTAHLLSELSLQVRGSSNAAAKAGTHGIRVA